MTESLPRLMAYHRQRALRFRALLAEHGLRVPEWKTVDHNRLRGLERRMKVEGLVHPALLWDEAERVWLPVDPEKLKWAATIGILLRVPQRGTPDHFQRAKEGAYRPEREKSDSQDPRPCEALRRAHRASERKASESAEEARKIGELLEGTRKRLRIGGKAQEA